MQAMHTCANGKYSKSLKKAPGALISNLAEDRGRLFEGGAYSKGDAYVIFPKSWPDMITFLIHHVRINTNISCLVR